MTADEIAALVPCHREYVLGARRAGYAVVRKVGTTYDYCPISALLIRWRKMDKRKWMILSGNTAWKYADNPREFCYRHNVPCVLPQIRVSCDECPRENWHSEVASVQCDTLEEIKALMVGDEER